MSADPHALTDVLCALRCGRDADGWAGDGFDEPGTPYCASCIMLVADREFAELANPFLTLPPLDPHIGEAKR